MFSRNWKSRQEPKEMICNTRKWPVDHMNSECSDQYMYLPVWWGPWRFWSECMNAQAGLSLYYQHIAKTPFIFIWPEDLGLHVTVWVESSKFRCTIPRYSRYSGIRQTCLSKLQRPKLDVAEHSIVCLCWGFTAQSTHGVMSTTNSLPNHTFTGQA